MSSLIFSPAIRRITLGAAALTAVSPALAQPVVAQPVVVQPVVVQPVVVQSAPEQIVIVGHYRKLPDNVDSASSVVSYDDLDLSNPAARDILRHRISLTARYLCDKLGESDDARSGSSCREAATRDAMQRVGTIEEHFAPRGTAWVRPPAWSPPYPQTWVALYP
jgi:UrcA family protein